MFGILSGLAEYFGVTEPALRLLFTILAGYPVALIHRHYYHGKSPKIQHLFFIISGFLLGFYNFGLDMLHTTANVIAVYGMIHILGPSLFTAVIILTFNMAYLLIGYIVTETDSYDIVWTMPHCILALRLSGLGFDIYDGTLEEESLSKESKRCAVKELPSILEIMGYTYFPTAFIVGPQFPLTKYRELVAGKCKLPNEDLPNTVWPALKRGASGIIYLALYTYGISIYNTEFLVSDEFVNDYGILSRITISGIWAHIYLYKYLSCWLISEGSCILIGIACNGKDAQGNLKWDGCANVNIYMFETGKNFSKDYVHSFNINTNNWVLQYVYKRLKFLGNKYYSQFGVLFFLALWHGFHSGYYMSFFLEFIGVAAEKDFEIMLEKNRTFLEFVSRPGIKQVVWIILKYYNITFMGPCIAPFVLLSYDRWLKFHMAVCFLPHLLWAGYFLYKPLLKKLLPKNDP